MASIAAVFLAAAIAVAAAPRSMVRRGMVRLRRIQSGCPRQTHHTGDRARAGRPQDPRSGTAHLLGDAVAPAVSGRLVQTLRLQPVRAAQRVDPLGTGRAVVVVLDHAGVDRGNAYRSVDRRLAGTDFVFIMRAADGRMDMMSAALGYAALAAYLVLRNRSLNLAVFSAHSLVVLSGLTHPNGGLLSFAGRNLSRTLRRQPAYFIELFPPCSGLSLGQSALPRGPLLFFGAGIFQKLWSPPREFFLKCFPRNVAGR